MVENQHTKSCTSEDGFQAKQLFGDASIPVDYCDICINELNCHGHKYECCEFLYRYCCIKALPCSVN